jgi:hypothetical protein
MSDFICIIRLAPPIVILLLLLLLLPRLTLALAVPRQLALWSNVAYLPWDLGSSIYWV